MLAQQLFSNIKSYLTFTSEVEFFRTENLRRIRQLGIAGYQSVSHLIELIHDLNNQTVSITDVFMVKLL